MSPEELRGAAQDRVLARVAAARTVRDRQTAQRARQALARRHGLQARHAEKTRRSRQPDSTGGEQPDGPDPAA